jgi:hypothetical protein
MDALGTILAIVTLVAQVASKLSDISSDYKAAFPELSRIENGLKRLNEVLESL